MDLIKLVGGWGIKILGLKKDEMTAENLVFFRPEDNKFFHLTLVKNDLPGGKFYMSPMLFEHGDGNKVGDIVVTLRKSPTGRWMVQVEKETVFVTETETIEVFRSKRSSLDNEEPSIKRSVVKVGEGYSNPRRIGGKPIFCHYLLAGWSPQLAENMMDVFDFLLCTDMIGQSCFLRSLQHMPDEVAREIFSQMRAPDGKE